MSILPSVESLSLRLATLRGQAAALTERLAVVESEKRTKQKAGENEAKDIAAIITGINTKNACGARIAAAFAHKFPEYEILSARPRQGGNRNTHYDFEALIRSSAGATESWVRIEHKGSYKYSAIKTEETPWSAGVQFHNGGCEKYSIAKKYARTWYDTYIASGVFVTEFGLTKPVPTYDDWFKSDCKAQDDPKTEYGKELKAIVRAAANGSLLGKRAAVNAALTITDEDVGILKEEVRAIANQALEQKDYWLTIRGDLDGEFECAWYPQFTITTIEEVLVTKKKDIELEFRCNDNFVFHGILRWGKGAGFSNLRLDLK